MDRNVIESNIKTKKQLKTSLRNLLVKRLNEYSVYDKMDVRDYLRNTESMAMFKTQKEEDPHFDAYRIRNIMFELLVYILKNYRLYFLDEAKK